MFRFSDYMSMKKSYSILCNDNLIHKILFKEDMYVTVIFHFQLFLKLIQ